jgi:hypothetical protein
VFSFIAPTSLCSLCSDYYTTALAEIGNHWPQGTYLKPSRNNLCQNKANQEVAKSQRHVQGNKAATAVGLVGDKDGWGRCRPN